MLNDNVTIATSEIKKSCLAFLALQYGSPIPKCIRQRLNEELLLLKEIEITEIFREAQNRMRKAKEQGGIFVAKGTLPSLLIAYCLGLSNINPLPAHYICPNCKTVEWSAGVNCGLDLPDKKCKCGIEMKKDGFRIPYQTFFTGRKKGVAHLHWDTDMNEFASENALSDHPHIQIKNSGSLQFLKELESETTVKMSNVPLSGDELFLLVKTNDLLGIFDFQTEFAKKILAVVKPNSISDLIRILGFTHGTGVWKENGERLLNEKYCRINDLPTTRDDVFFDLLLRGLNHEAFLSSSAVIKGLHSFPSEQEKIDFSMFLKNAGMPDWYIEYLRKSDYLISKAILCELIRLDMIAAWYKVHYREQYDRIYSKKTKKQSKA